MRKSPEDWKETQWILQCLQAKAKEVREVLYDFYNHFNEADSSDYGKRPHCVIRDHGRLVSVGVAKRGIFQHPPLHGSCGLYYHSILPIPDYIQELWLDFYIGILTERPDEPDRQQAKFSHVPHEEDKVRFTVRINKEVGLEEKRNTVGWVPRPLPIKLPTDGKLIVEFHTDAMGALTFNWAAWGEPQLVGIYAEQKEVAAAVVPKHPAKGTDSGTNEHQIDFAIITALEKEAKAVVGRLENYSKKRFEDKDIRTYHCGTVPIQGTDREYRVVVVLLPSMGEISAANAVTDTIARWNPRFVLMVGIAGGIPQNDLDLGDVVVADQIIGYEYGKVTEDGIKPRDRVYPVSALLLDRVRNFWDESWAQQVNVPRPDSATRAVSKLFIGPIASGNKVIASTEFRQRLKTRWPKLVALEMEGEGVFAAVFDRPQIRNTLVIRGICDMADERKSDEWQEYAANAAAAFTVSFLKGRPVEPQE
jgi:nucleoside phosphorylase